MIVERENDGSINSNDGINNISNIDNIMTPTSVAATAEQRSASLSSLSFSSSTTMKSVLLLQLTAMFHSHYWWMPSFILIRRLILTAVLVSINNATVWIWLTLINYILFGIHLHLLPYERVIDNRFEIVNIIIIEYPNNIITCVATAIYVICVIWCDEFIDNRANITNVI